MFPASAQSLEDERTFCTLELLVEDGWVTISGLCRVAEEQMAASGLCNRTQRVRLVAPYIVSIAMTKRQLFLRGTQKMHHSCKEKVFLVSYVHPVVS